MMFEWVFVPLVIRFVVDLFDVDQQGLLALSLAEKKKIMKLAHAPGNFSNLAHLVMLQQVTLISVF